MTEHQITNTIKVMGLAPGVTEESLKLHFGCVGTIKQCDIKKDDQGQPTGEASITYQDVEAVDSAMDWFNGKPFYSVILTLNPTDPIGELEQPAPGSQYNQSSDSSSQKRKFRRENVRNQNQDDRNTKDQQKRPGWTCPECGNHNWQVRTSCYKCGVPRPANEINQFDSDSHHQYEGGDQGRNRQRGRGDGTHQNQWICPRCQNRNWGWRLQCNKCQLDRPTNPENFTNYKSNFTQQTVYCT
ncbi:MAG: hypothetical protein EZS28_020801, partial [Streblomastix strix]